MPVLLRRSSDLPEPSAYDSWFAVTGARGRGAPEKRMGDVALHLEDAFNAVAPEWWRVGRELASGPGAELAYAPTCAAYGSDFGLMMAWCRWVRDLAATEQRCLVACDDPWLYRQLAAIPGVAAGKAPPLWPRALMLTARGWLARVRLIARLALTARGLRRQRATHAPGDPVILVYGHPRSTAHGDDAYFGPLMRRMKEVKRLLHTDCPAGRARELGADGRTASLHAWGPAWWRTPALMFALWRPTPEQRNGNWGWLVRRAAALEGGGAAHTMNAWQRLCHDSWLGAVRPRAVAWPWENHGWERAFCRTARQLGVATVGYQHTVIGPHQLNYAPATNVDGEASFPDTVACGGPAYRDQLAAWGVDPGRLSIVGSLRILAAESDAFDAAGPVFVALSARRSIARQQVAAVEEAAKSGFRFAVKEHPMYPLAVRESENVRRATGTVLEQRGVSGVLYSTGTSGLEALLAGLPTFRLLPEDEIAVDVLPDFAAPVIVTAETLVEALAQPPGRPNLDWDRVLAPVDWALWESLLGTSATAVASVGGEPPPSSAAVRGVTGQDRMLGTRG